MLLLVTGFIQQREAMAGGNRPLRVRQREQAACWQQVRSHHEESRRLHHSQCELYSLINN